FCLVESLQGAVMAFVEAPVVVDRNPHQVHLVEHQPERADGALEDGGERAIKLESCRVQNAAGLSRLALTLGGQIDIGPACEPVLLVPGRFAVANQYEFVHGVEIPGLRKTGFAHCALTRRVSSELPGTYSIMSGRLTSGSLARNAGRPAHGAATDEWRLGVLPEGTGPIDVKFITDPITLASASVALLSGATIVFTQFSSRSGARALSTLEATQLINSRNALVIDVRSAEEFSVGSITHARNYPFETLKEKASEL